jgi:phosphodiesterase/alkaline phosphatase D-like protein
VPTANAATSVTSTGFAANWSSASGATGYRLDVSTSSTFNSYVSGYQNLDLGNVITRSVGGLSANTTYYYRVRAYNSSGTSGNSGTITATTPPNPPSVPTANAATSVTSTGFAANWSSASGATGYRLDVSTSGTFSSYVSGYQSLDLGNATTRSVSGLSANTTYYYQVRAYNSSGTSGNSGTITATTPPIPPSAPTANPATSVTSTGFTANWSSASGATGYRLDVSTSSTFGSYASGYQDLDVGNVTTQSVSGTSANTVYYYRLRAYNTDGTSGNSGTSTVTTLQHAPVIVTSGPGFGFNGGQFGFILTGPTGPSVVVEASTDLVSWLSLWTNTFAGALNFSDPQSGVYSNRFYRAHTP